MAEKQLKVRHIQRHDLEVNWLKAVNFVPGKGEIIVYDIEVDENKNILKISDGNGGQIDCLPRNEEGILLRATPYTYERFKIGDGITKVSKLPFAINPHGHVGATQSTAGFMSAADKAKLDGIDPALIEDITTSKVNVSDIIDNLVSTAIDKPLSAKQGKALNDIIGTLSQDLSSEISLREAQINGLNFSLKEEVNRAKTSEGSISTALQEEQQRAIAAEEANAEAIHNLGEADTKLGLDIENVRRWAQDLETGTVDTMQVADEARKNKYAPAAKKRPINTSLFNALKGKERIYVEAANYGGVYPVYALNTNAQIVYNPWGFNTKAEMFAGMSWGDYQAYLDYKHQVITTKPSTYDAVDKIESENAKDGRWYKVETKVVEGVTTSTYHASMPSIATRVNNAQIRVPANPVDMHDAASKNYVDGGLSNKIDKNAISAEATSDRVLIRSGATHEYTSVPVTSYSSAGAIAARTGNQELMCETSEDSVRQAAVNKGYLENEVAKLESQDSIIREDLRALEERHSRELGDIYNDLGVLEVEKAQSMQKADAQRKLDKATAPFSQTLYETFVKKERVYIERGAKFTSGNSEPEYQGVYPMYHLNPQAAKAFNPWGSYTKPSGVEGTDYVTEVIDGQLAYFSALSSVAQRQNDGNIRVNKTPVNSQDATSKAYVDGKVNAINTDINKWTPKKVTTNGVLVKNSETLLTIPYSSTANSGYDENTLVRRTSDCGILIEVAKNNDGTVNTQSAINTKYLNERLGNATATIQHSPSAWTIPLRSINGDIHCQCTSNMKDTACVNKGYLNSQLDNQMAQIATDYVSQNDFKNLGCTIKNNLKESLGLEFTSNNDGTCKVTGIGDHVDSKISIPLISPNGDKVVTIGQEAFANNANITEVIISDNVTSIEQRAFYQCTNLKNVTIGAGVTHIGVGAFSSCTDLIAIIPETVTQIDSVAFSNVKAIYCKAASKPKGWNVGWNYFEDNVTWSFVEDFFALARRFNKLKIGEWVDINTPSIIDNKIIYYRYDISESGVYEVYIYRYPGADSNLYYSYETFIYDKEFLTSHNERVSNPINSIYEMSPECCTLHTACREGTPFIFRVRKIRDI